MSFVTGIKALQATMLCHRTLSETVGHSNERVVSSGKSGSLRVLVDLFLGKFG
jgi:hypothetical protein